MVGGVRRIETGLAGHGGRQTSTRSVGTQRPQLQRHTAVRGSPARLVVWIRSRCAGVPLLLSGATKFVPSTGAARHHTLRRREEPARELR
jgi:hypothetical protein